MAGDMIERPVPAPARDWLSEAEVLSLLGDISSRTLDRYIREGAFPAAVVWGRDPRWRWEDVAWFHLGKLLSSRLAGSGEPTDEDGSPPQERHESDTTTTRERRRSANPRQPGAGASGE